MFEKSAQYGKSAARSQVAARMLKWSASKLIKAAFKPISILSVFNVTETVMSDTTREIDRLTAEAYLPGALAAYCEKYNNYRMIINQKYFEQG
jgi:hypothetical protein